MNIRNDRYIKRKLNFDIKRANFALALFFVAKFGIKV